MVRCLGLVSGGEGLGQERVQSGSVLRRGRGRRSNAQKDRVKNEAGNTETKIQRGAQKKLGVVITRK